MAARERGLRGARAARAAARVRQAARGRRGARRRRRRGAQPARPRRHRQRAPGGRGRGGGRGPLPPSRRADGCSSRRSQVHGSSPPTDRSAGSGTTARRPGRRSAGTSRVSRENELAALEPDGDARWKLVAAERPVPGLGGLADGHAHRVRHGQPAARRRRRRAARRRRGRRTGAGARAARLAPRQAVRAHATSTRATACRRSRSTRRGRSGARSPCPTRGQLVWSPQRRTARRRRARPDRLPLRRERPSQRRANRSGGARRGVLRATDASPIGPPRRRTQRPARRRAACASREPERSPPRPGRPTAAGCSSAWVEADQWLFVRASGPRRVRAVANVAGAVRLGEPTTRRRLVLPVNRRCSSSSAPSRSRSHRRRSRAGSAGRRPSLRHRGSRIARRSRSSC